MFLLLRTQLLEQVGELEEQVVKLFTALCLLQEAVAVVEVE